MYVTDKQLAKKFGVHRTAIWRWVQKGDFPKPVKLSPGCTRWVDEAIREWEQKKAKVAEA